MYLVPCSTHTDKYLELNDHPNVERMDFSLTREARFRLYAYQRVLQAAISDRTAARNFVCTDANGAGSGA